MVSEMLGHCKAECCLGPTHDMSCFEALSKIGIFLLSDRQIPEKWFFHPINRIAWHMNAPDHLFLRAQANLAQLVEHFIRNERVVGSTPIVGSVFLFMCSPAGLLDEGPFPSP